MVRTKEKATDESAETNVSNNLVQSVYINPLTDFGFKKLFYNKELLIPFLNDIMGMDIKDIDYKPTEGLGWFSEERTAVFDLLCTTNNDEHFVVEMQLGQQPYFIERALFYGSHMIRKQAPRKKNWDFNLKPVYIVSILDFNVFRDKASKKRAIERVYLYRESNKELFTDKFLMVFIQLPKFKKKLPELHDNTDTWLYLLKNTEKLKSCPPEIKGKPFKLFLEIAELIHLTPEDMDRYAVSLEKSYQMRNIADFARMEGKIENSKKIAIKLLKKNEPIDEIISLTELSREEVMMLMSQLPKV
jgi:predicted transposase/invertase (TIGR01784 family)